MAAPKENLLSLGHLTDTERQTCTKQRQHSLKKSVHRPMLLQADFSTGQSHDHLRVMQLQHRWLELKEREHAAIQYNRQLLWQFEKAQDTLREMLARNAAMKTIRMEYERYLEESAPRWQQQLQEKTQDAQRKRMEKYLRSRLKNTEEEQMTKSSVDQTLLSQGLTKKPQISAPQENNNQNSDYNQDVSSHLQSSWLTHIPSQTSRFPIRVPCQLQGSHVPPSYLPPPSIFPHPYQFQLHHLASTPTHHHHTRRRQDPQGWASPKPDYPWSLATGAGGVPSCSEALWGQLYMEEPPYEKGVEAEMSRALSSNSERGGGSRSSPLSHELDIKPVRLSSGHAESSESGRDCSQASREKTKKREKRGKTRRASSGRERCCSRESARNSSEITMPGVALDKSSESDASSEKPSTGGDGRTRRKSVGLAVGLPRMENMANERNRGKGDDSGSHSNSEGSGSQAEESRIENSENQSPDDKSDSCREEESESVSIKIESGVAEKEKQESSSSAEESSAEEKDEEEGEHKKALAEQANDDVAEKENNQRDEEQTRDAEEDEVSARENTTEEEEEMEAGDELKDEGDAKDKLKTEDSEKREHGSASSQDEDVDEEEYERDENNIGEDEEGSDEEEDGEGEREEEHGSDEAGEPEEESDSEDSIISPEENRPKKTSVIPEEAAEEDDDDGRGRKTGSTDEDSNEFSEEDDIENLLAPSEQTKKKEEKDLEVDDKPKAACDNVEIFQVEDDSSKNTDHQSDSDEFDDFYD